MISTGGGFIGVPNIREIGILVYLHSDFDSIIDGILTRPNVLKKIKKRPLLKDLDAVRILSEKRLPVYQQLADVEVDMTDRQIESVAEEIVARAACLLQ